jgi:hypothetical protein
MIVGRQFRSDRKYYQSVNDRSCAFAPAASRNKLARSTTTVLKMPMGHAARVRRIDKSFFGSRATMKMLYDLLGALPHDDAEGLRTAFRRAVKGAHPDIRPGDSDAVRRLENRRVGCRPHPTLSRRKGFRWPVLTSTHQKSFVLMHEDYPNAGRRCGSRD